jgi:hypothetical protein
MKKGLLSLPIWGAWMLFGCQSTPYKTTQTQKQTSNNQLSCAQLVDSLIRTSSYKNALGEKNVTYDIDDIDSGVIMVHAFHKNEDGRDVTVGWLAIDLNQNRMEDKDPSIDEDSTVLVKSFDNRLLGLVKEHCK